MKKYHFDFPAGTCVFEKRNKKYSFTVKGEGCILRYVMPSIPVVDAVLSSYEDISDTARGLVDIALVGAWDRAYADKLLSFSKIDSFIPTFIGNYHTCLIENTPWSETQIASVKTLFSTDAAKYFDDMLGMFVDCEDMVVVSPANVISQVNLQGR